MCKQLLPHGYAARGLTEILSRARVHRNLVEDVAQLVDNFLELDELDKKAVVVLGHHTFLATSHEIWTGGKQSVRFRLGNKVSERAVQK
jgi:hypothetical protein